MRDKLVLVISNRIECAIYDFRQAHSKAIRLDKTTYSHEGLIYRFAPPFSERIHGHRPMRVEVHNRHLISQEVLDFVDAYNKSMMEGL